jgi:hypothetical protein
LNFHLSVGDRLATNAASAHLVEEAI